MRNRLDVIVFVLSQVVVAVIVFALTLWVLT